VIRSISLEDGQTGLPIEAEFLPLSLNHVADYEQHWVPLLDNEQDEDVQAFNWRLKQRWATSATGREAYALLVEGRVQGMIFIEVNRHTSRSRNRTRLVYIESLAVAPWNRYSKGRSRVLKGVGKALLFYAKERSIELGYQGRVGLESLPGSVGFYEQLGLIQLDPEPDDILDEPDNLPYFEYRPPYQTWEFHDDE
jgi:hypothetical protein